MLKLSIEHKFIINKLFKGNYNIKTNKVDDEKLIKIISSHLIIPALYSSISNKEKKFFKREFIDFLEFVSNENKKRNEILLKEISHLVKIFCENKVNFSLLKGSQLLELNLYKNNFVRMIGDIDVLVEQDSLDLAYKILKKNKYHNLMNYKVWNVRHQPRFINTSKDFAIEIHSTILRPKLNKILNFDLNYLQNGDIELLIKVCILNFQINDYGYFKASFNYRTIYDYYILNSLKKIDLKNFNNIYFKRFFLVTNFLGITDFTIKKSFFDKLFILRFSFKRRLKLYYLLDEIICNSLILLSRRLKQFCEFIFNKQYRSYIIKKLFFSTYL